MIQLTPIQIKNRASELGFDTCGICSADPPESLEVYKQWLDRGNHGTMDYLATSLALRSDLRKLLPEVQSVIAVTLNYHQNASYERGFPRIAQYALGRDYHKVMRKRLRRFTDWIEQSAPDVKCRICVDSAPVLEREYANRAGLGWYGKNTCLIDSKRGSLFFIGLILTSAKWPFDKPAIGGCGSCRACIDACPTGAIVQVDNRWQVDARRCISYLTIEHRGGIDPELHHLLGDWTFGCDVCQDVCPFNHQRPSQPARSQTTKVADFRDRKPWPSLSKMVHLSYDEWDRLTQGSAVRRAGFDGIKRNAHINLTNANDELA